MTSKVSLPDDDKERDYAGRIRRSLHGSLDRLGRQHLDLLLLHTQLRPRDAAAPKPPDNIGRDDYLGEVTTEFGRLRNEDDPGVGHHRSRLPRHRARRAAWHPTP